MKTVLIGGGSIGKDNTKYETKEIDEEITKLSEKEKPNFLYIGFASKHSERNFKLLKNIYQKLNCKTTQLKRKTLEQNFELAEKKLEEADIIYIGGGDTIELIEIMEKYNIKKHLEKAKNRNCVLVGMSAGAIYLSQAGFSDSKILRGESNHYTEIKGIGFAPINICPHFHESQAKTIELQEWIKKEKKTYYGLENQTAIIYINQERIIIKSNPTANVYQCEMTNNYQERVLN